MNRAQRRRSQSNKKGGTQLNHPTFVKKMKAEQDDRKKAGKNTGGITALQRSGYKKLKKCELCGFKAQDKAQLDVLFVDSDLRNTAATNLKTVCANCQRLTSTRRLGWRVGDLVADE